DEMASSFSITPVLKLRQERPLVVLAESGKIILALQLSGDYSMKKTLVALAVLGTVGAVHAQTAVVIDGSIDTSIVNRAAANGTKTTTMERNQRNTNYIGISGSEDLGRGLKAIFQVRTA